MTAPRTQASVPSFARAVAVVAGKDLRLEWRTLGALSSMVLFALIVLVVFNFAFDLGTVREVGVARLVPGVLWITLAFAGIVGFARSFQIERRRDSLLALVTAPVGRGSLFVGKALANLVLLLVLELVLLPLSGILFDYDLVVHAAPLTLVLLAHTLGLAELGTLFGAVAAQVGRGEALLATLLFPAAAPLLISAVECTAKVLGGEGLAAVQHWMLVTLGLDALFFFLGLATFEFVVED